MSNLCEKKDTDTYQGSVGYRVDSFDILKYRTCSALHPLCFFFADVERKLQSIISNIEIVTISYSLSVSYISIPISISDIQHF